MNTGMHTFEVLQSILSFGSNAHGQQHSVQFFNVTNKIGPAESKWTAREPTLGWRHFTVIDRKTTDVATYALLEATCEPEATLWVSSSACSQGCI